MVVLFWRISLLFLSLNVSGLILPMTKSNGDPDMVSIINHVTLMDQTMTNLQTQVQAMAGLQTQVKNLQTQVQASTTELTTVKAQLQTTESELKTSKDEITALKSELRSVQINAGILKHDLQRAPDPIEFHDLKTALQTLKLSQNNITVIDAVSADVKSNMRDIQSLKADLQNGRIEVSETRTEVSNIATQVLVTNIGLNQTIREVEEIKAVISKKFNTTETRLTVVEAGLSSVKSRQNVTERDVSATRSDVQKTTSDVKDIQAQVSTVSGDQSGLRKEFSLLKNRTDVAYQVTQRGLNKNGYTTLKFDTVDLNNGFGYNQTSGMFKVPVSGTYIFWAQVLFFRGTADPDIYIYVGQKKMHKGFFRLQDTNDAGYASLMSVIHLYQEDQVHFTTDYNGSWIGGGSESSYGGALLSLA